MKKIAKFISLLIIAMLTFAPMEAKTTKKKTSTTQRTKTSRSFVKWKNNIPTPEYIYQVFINWRISERSFYNDLRSKGYKENDDPDYYMNIEYDLPDVCSFYWAWGHDPGLTGVLVRVDIEDPDMLDWYIEEVRALQRKKDLVFTVHYYDNGVGLEAWW